MKRISSFALSFALGFSALIMMPFDAEASPIISNNVIYLEVRPTNLTAARAKFKDQLLLLRKANPGIIFYLLHELDRPNQFVLLALSRNTPNSSYTSEFVANQFEFPSLKILPNFNLDSTLMPGSTPLNLPIGGFAMVAHLDADPTKRDDTLPMLNDLLNLVPTINGNKGIQILSWKLRSNHWTLIESWNSRRDFYNSLEKTSIALIRARIAANAAAPSDLRLYRRLE